MRLPSGDFLRFGFKKSNLDPSYFSIEGIKVMFLKKVLLALLCMLPLGAADRAIIFNQGDLDDMLVSYSEEERVAIQKDHVVIEKICFEGKSPRSSSPLYLATAGAPGARKSTILEHLLREDPRFSRAVYLDPDQRALKWMIHTFYSCSLTADAVSRYEQYPMLQKAAYDKWRAGSNYIANSILEKALRGHYDIAHGTTMTGPFVSRLLSLMKDEGYYITLALCSCEDRVRFDAIQYRNEVQGFYQTDPHDVVKKGLLFPKKVPFYFEYADELRLFWSEGFDAKEKLAALFSQKGIKILDQEAYDHFVDKYERDRVQLNLEEKLDLPKWVVLVKSWKR